LTGARRAWRVWAVVALASTAAGACSSKPQKLAKAPPARSVAPKPALQRGAVTLHGLAAVHARAIGPTIARRVDGGEVRASVAAWITAGAGSARRLLLQPLDTHGAPIGRVLALADVPLQTSHLVVRPSGGAAGGFVLAWMTLTDRGKALWALAVRDDGMPRARPIEIAHTDDDIVWTDVVPTRDGALCMWAEETRDRDANLVAALLVPDGRIKGSPTRVAVGVTNWHVSAERDGAALVVARAAPGDAKAAKAAKRTVDADDKEISLLRLDPTGAPAGAPVVVNARTQVWGDLEAVHAVDGLVIAWTDRAAAETRVSAARVSARDEVSHTVLVEGRGGARLLGLATGGAGTAVMWDSTLGRDPMRVVHLGHVSSGPDGLTVRGRPASFKVQGDTRPELAATKAGFVVMGPMPACAPEAAPKGEPCVPIVAPTLLRVDARGVAVQTELLSLADDVAATTWGLSCHGEDCLALGADRETPARVTALEIAPRVNMAAPEAPAAPAEDAPRITGTQTLQASESLIAVGSARFGDALVVATLGVPTDESSKAGARVATRIVAADGTATPPIVLSTRALPVGGLAIAPAGGKETGGAVAWVARENGHPEVHVTRLDKKGKRTNDIQLTTSRGDASDVAIAWSGNGFVVAWVDTRDGNGEVYATRVSPQLERNSREERITKAPGDASDLVALAHGGVVWLAWADPRENARYGRSDVFVTAVKDRDAKRAIDEVRLAATAAHSRTPRLAPDGDGVHVAWIEEAPAGAASPSAAGYGAMHVRLDATGKPRRPSKRLPLGGEGAASSVALEPHAGALRAVIARAERDRVVLDAAVLDGETERATPLMPLSGPPSMDVVLHLRDGVLYFNDDGPTNVDKRARRAVVDWRK
jgi:hypothetical protein